MVALNAAGVAVGWGMQFQQPLFLIGMVALLALFACNLWGFFEVPLPSALAALGSAGEARGLLGNFADRRLRDAAGDAVLGAVPRHRHRLRAWRRARSRSSPIFLALGVGLAAPYLLVALLPRLAPWLPRPGRWMITLRRVLGLALAATAVWLVSVLAAQTGVAAALAAGALIAAAAVALLLSARAGAAAGRAGGAAGARRSPRPRCFRAAPPRGARPMPSGSPSIARRSIGW